MDLQTWHKAFRHALGGYAGTKVLLADSIASELMSRAPHGYVLDIFCGMCSVAYRLKLAGRPVAAVDSMRYPHTVATAIIANNTVRLAPDAVEWLVSDHGNSDDFMLRTFHGRYLPDHVLHGIDVIRGNLRYAEANHWVTPTTFALAMAALCRSAQTAKSHSNFNADTVSSRISTTSDFISLYRSMAERINGLVSDNGCQNLAYWGDGPTFMQDTKNWKRPVAAAYLDPPYVTSRSVTSYWGRYWFLEGIVEDWATVRGGMSVTEFSHYRDYCSREQIRELIFDAIESGEHIPVLAVSYDGEGTPTPDEIRDVLQEQGRKIVTLSTTHYRLRVRSVEVLVIGCLPVAAEAAEDAPDYSSLVHSIRQSLERTNWPEDTVDAALRAIAIYEDGGDIEPLLAAAKRLGIQKGGKKHERTEAIAV